MEERDDTKIAIMGKMRVRANKPSVWTSQALLNNRPI